MKSEYSLRGGLLSAVSSQTPRNREAAVTQNTPKIIKVAGCGHPFRYLRKGFNTYF
jgi:hypothetical protein